MVNRHLSTSLDFGDVRSRPLTSSPYMFWWFSSIPGIHTGVALKKYGAG